MLKESAIHRQPAPIPLIYKAKMLRNRNVIDFAWSKTFLCVESTVLGFGEDPRAFVFQDKPACYSTLFRENYSNLNRLFIKNASGWDVLNLINEKSFPSGKNWIPFVYRDEIYFIHGFSPFRILKLNEILVKTQKCRTCVYKLDLLGGSPSAPANP